VPGGDAGERVAKEALPEALEVRIAGRDAREKRSPEGTLAARRYGRHARHVIVRVVSAKLARAQVDDASRRVEQPSIAVPLVYRCSEAAVGLGELLDGSDGARIE